jgi:hypothetical protein
LLVSQDEPLVERFVLESDGGWKLRTASGLDGELVIDSVPLRVPMADVYRGVVFPPSPPLREPVK